MSKTIVQKTNDLPQKNIYKNKIKNVKKMNINRLEFEVCIKKRNLYFWDANTFFFSTFAMRKNFFIHS
jgi:hypothetical protein